MIDAADTVDTQEATDNSATTDSPRTEAENVNLSPDALLAEPPKGPEWQAGKPGVIARRLMKLAGVDPHLALQMPADEQQQMQRVGLALLFGVALQGILFGSSLAAGFGFQDWTIPVTFVICGVMWTFDTKFVAADWAAQGQAFCQTHGLIPESNWKDKWSRIGTWALRWTVAGFVAWTLATFVELRLFEPAIVARWADEYRVRIQPTIDGLLPRYETLLADKSKQLGVADQRIAALAADLADAAAGSSDQTVDIDQQIADRVERTKKLEAQRDDALQSESDQRREVLAEKFGVRLHDGNTGKVGEGSYYNFHNDLAKQYEAAVTALNSEIENNTKDVAEFRRQRAAIQSATKATNLSQRDALERRLGEEREIRARLAAEYQALQNNREEWLTARLRESPGFVPMPSGIVAKMEALAEITTGNWLIASMVFLTKILIMLLESAGPVAKVAFTAAGLYQMTIALRVHDAAEMEADRRLRWQHWRLIMRRRNQDAIDAIRTTQRRRATEAQARDALQKIIEKASWMH